MPVSSGPTSPAPPVFGKSGLASWHLLHSSLAKISRPVFGSPGGILNFQPGGTPPPRCSSSMVIGFGGFAAGAGAGPVPVPWPACWATASPRPSPSVTTAAPTIASLRGRETSMRRTLPQLAFDGQLDPHRDGLRPAPRGLEAPAAHGLGRRAVEIRVAG